MIQHEDDLRNQRLGYLLTLNGLLFAGLAFAWKSSPHSLVFVLAAMGILIAASALWSMVLSDRAIRYLRNRDPIARNNPRVPTYSVAADVELGSIPVAFSSQLPSPESADDPTQRKRVRRLWRWLVQPWHALPIILGGAWVAILIIDVHHAGEVGLGGRSQMYMPPLTPMIWPVM
jgi:hypothetical protein